MDQDQLLQNWLQQKFLSGGYFELLKPLTVQYELKTQPVGCYYDYAYVCLDCNPASELSFQSIVEWPESVEASYQVRVEQAVCCGVADILVSRNLIPYRGCAVRLSVALWDYIGSSEEAFYQATKAAMEELIDGGGWRYLQKPGA